MKNLIALLMLGSTWAYADWSPLKVFNNQDFPALAALECPGHPALHLLNAVKWRNEGAQIPETTDDMKADLENLKALGHRISPATTFLALERDLDKLEKHVEYSNDLQIDKESLGLPATLYGCKVIPLAVDARQIRAGAPYLVDAEVFDRLASQDKILAKVILGGVKESVLRTLIDESTLQKSLTERFQLHAARGVPTVFNGSVDIMVVAIDKDTKIVDGRLSQARASADTYYSPVHIYLSPTGTLRFIDFLSQYGVNVLQRPEKISGVFATKKDKGMMCTGAFYREEGSMSACFNRGSVKFYSVTGDAVSTASKVMILRRDKVDVEKDWVFNSQPPQLPQDFLIHDNFGRERQIDLMGLPQEVESFRLVAGEPSCSTLKHETENGYLRGRYHLHIKVPANCVGLVHVTYKKVEPYPKMFK